jgi:hypothetical protein
MSTVTLDSYVLDTLMPDLVGHDRHPAAFVVYLALWHRTHDARNREVAMSLRELTEATGLSKRAVQVAVRRLARRKLLTVERAGVTSIPVYGVSRPWVRRK